MSVTLYDNTVLTVEIGFSTSSGGNRVPLGGSLSDIVWTDVSSYVRSVSTQRGRNNELDEFATGTASVVLSNADRRFDPEYAAGPYYGSVTPGRPIRVRASYNGGTTYGVFFGWVDGWAQQYTLPSDATVAITASDGFKILNQLTLDGSWDLETEALAPWCWWKFGETAPAQAAFGYGSRPADLTWVNASGQAVNAQSAASLVPDSDTGSAEINSNYLIRSDWFGPTLTLSDYNLETLELVFSTSITTDGSYGIARFQGFEYVMGVGMVVSGGVGTLKFWSGSLSGINFVRITASDVVVNDGASHIIHLGNYWDFLPQPIQPMVDGVESTYTGLRTWTGGYGTDALRSQIGLSMTQLDGDNFTSNFVGTVDEVVIHSQLLTKPQCLDRVQQMKGAYGQGETSGARLGRLLNYAEWMTDARIVSGGNSTMAGVSILGQTVLDAVKETGNGEQGRIFVDGDGKVELIPRLSIYTVSEYSTPQATFGDGAGELPYSDVQFSYDDRLIINRSTASRQGGATFTSESTASQESYFLRSESISDLAVDTDEFVKQVAAYRIAFYKDPETRIESLEIKPRVDAANLFPKALAYDVGTRITVKRRPQGVGSPISKDLLIEGVSHDISIDSWSTRWTLSPVPIDAFILDSATMGILDTSLLGL
jgi:hypothetical protein